MKNTKSNPKKIFNGKLKPCIICKKKKFENWAKLNTFQAKRCLNCGMISVNPTPEQHFLDHYYEGYLEENKKDRKLWEQRKITYQIDKSWISKFIDHGKVLDIGCSGGQFLSYFEPKRWKRFGVEVDEAAANNAKKKFGINAKVGNVTDLEFKEKFDLIIMRGVIEHFSNPVNVLKKCSSLLKKGGYLYITATPAGDSFAFDVYRDKWHLFTPPGHLHFFTVQLLTRIVKQYGLELIDYHHQYTETPYANTLKDFMKIKNDIILLNSNKKEKVKTSPPFPGSMITAVWRKK
jgi:2-polyprenyl-3-methyl-5-hydroxy-6-metoxy-1,4-benzoquinol methylase